MAVQRRVARGGGVPSKRVARVRATDGRTGYLLVDTADVKWSDGTRMVGVTFSLQLQDPGGTWIFSDRADPDDFDASAELAAGIISWYGQSLVILEWLQGDEADVATRSHFGEEHDR